MAVKTLGGLARGLDVLESIAARAPVSGAELAELLGLERSALQRVLTTLSDAGWIRQDPTTRTWCAGPRALSFASSVDMTRPLVELAHPHLVALRDTTGETAFLAAARGDHAVVLDVVESTHLVRIAPRVGNRIDAELSAAMLAIAAFVPSEERDGLLAAVGRPDRLAGEIAATRRRGYGVNAGAVHAAATSVAAPVVDATGRAVAALVVTMPRERASRAAVRTASTLVVEAAAEVSVRTAGR